jgi:hypothetical protein
MPASRIDYKRELRELYAPGAGPAIVDVPELAFLMIDGHGDPNAAVEYREAVEALFAVSYAAKFAVKRAPEAVDSAVTPLEGLWWVPDMSTFSIDDKSDWRWTAMIMQPDPVTAEIIDAATRQAAAKKTLPALELLRFERFHEDLAAQVMYRGPYAMSSFGHHGPPRRAPRQGFGERALKRQRSPPSCRCRPANANPSPPSVTPRTHGITTTRVAQQLGSQPATEQRWQACGPGPCGALGFTRLPSAVRRLRVAALRQCAYTERGRRESRGAAAERRVLPVSRRSPQGIRKLASYPA